MFLKALHSDDFIFYYVSEDSSFKSKLKVACLSLYLFFTMYSGTRDGFIKFINDGRSISDFVIQGFKNNNEYATSIIRSERRTGLPGKISRLYERVDNLNQKIKESSNKEIDLELEKIKSEIIDIYNTIDRNSRNLFLLDMPELVKETLPDQIPINEKFILNRYIIREEDRHKLTRLKIRIR